MLIYIIRHGETEWNKRDIFQGTMDSPLSQQGLLEAEAVAQRLQEVPFLAIYSSVLTRAYQTAETIASYHQLLVQKEKDLNEWKMGEWEGKKRETIKREYQDLYESWRKRRETSAIPGGESYIQFSNRVMRIFHRIMKKNEKGPLLVVTHDGVIKAIVSSLFQLPIDGVKFFRQNNTGINILEKKKDRYHLLLLNDQGHLRDLSKIPSF